MIKVNRANLNPETHKICNRCKGNGMYHENIYNPGTCNWREAIVLCDMPGCHLGIVDLKENHRIVGGSMTLEDAIKEVEKAHFRTVNDTGANPTAILVMNHFRMLAKYNPISKADLPAWDGVRYAMPDNSGLLIEVEERKKARMR
jgi:hypothetical protein